MSIRSIAVPGRHPASQLVALAGTAFVAALAACAGSAEPRSPYFEAASEESRSAAEAYGSGRVADAVSGLQESARLRLASGDLPGAARTLLNLSLALRASRGQEAAGDAAGRLRRLVPAAVQQERESRDPNKEEAAAEIIASSQWLDALLALDTGDMARATELAPPSDAGLATASPLRSRIDSLWASIALQSGRPADAEARARAARAAAEAARDPSEEAHALSLSGAAEIGLGNFGAARRDLLAAVEIEERLGAGTAMTADLRKLAVVAAHLNDPEGARLYALRADAISGAKADEHRQ